MPDIKLHEVRPRETSGASTGSRFRFQANLAVICACDLHLKSGSYTILVEHFDDITLYQPDNDKPLTFIQAKGKLSGSWSINQLTASKKDKPSPNSIVGKLYSNVPVFGESVAGLKFVSNAVFKLQLPDGSTSPADATEIPISVLHESELKKIAGALDPDFPSPRSPDCKDLLTLTRVPMDPKDEETYVVGRLAQLTEKLGLSGIAHSALYKTIHSEISAKSADVALCDSTEELLGRKGFSREAFNSVLAASSSAPRFEDFRPLLVSDLEAQGFGSLAIVRIINSCRDFIAKRSLGQNVENLVSERMQRLYREHPMLADECTTIWQLAQELCYLFENDDLPEELITSGAIVAISENING